jgi:hypothetical protein
MVSPSWADDKVVWCLDYRWEHAKLDCDKLDFFEIEFNLVVVQVEVLEIVDSSSGVDLFLNILLDRGDMCEPKVIGVAE